MALSLPLPGRSLHYGNLVNRDSPLNRGLVSWWLALPQGGKGNTFFDIAGKNHGTLTNGPTWGGSLGRPGGFGALTFDGSDDRVVFPSGVIGSLPNIQVTATVWIKPTNFTTAYRCVFDSGPNDSVRYLSAFLGSATTLFVAIAGAVGAEPTVSPAWTADEWQHLGITCDGTTTRIYKNGVQSGSTTASSSIGAGFTATEWRLGRYNAGTGPHFLGQQDGPKVWGRVLSASELYASYDDSRRGYPTTLNRVRPYTVFDVGGGGGGGNRRRRVLICGAAA